MPVVFFLARLREGADPAEYERWVRGFDYPTASKVPSIISYRVHRVEDAYLNSEFDCDYIEVVEVTDIDDYRRDLDQMPEIQELRRQIVEYLKPAGESTNYWTTRLE
jgi:hypothetical protein